jgi:hypothetical protein
VTTYLTLRDRIVALLAEYNAGVVEADGSSTYSKQTIYNRIADVYQQLVDEVAVGHGDRVADITDLTYAADSEYVDVNAGAAVVTPTLWNRKIVSMLQKEGDDRIPMKELSRSQYERALTLGVEDFLGDFEEYGWFLQGKHLYVLPRPSRALTIRVAYVAKVGALVAVTDDANSPERIPDEHHDLIAHLVALSFKGEAGGDTTALERAVAHHRARFHLWATGADRRGPRYVR